MQFGAATSTLALTSAVGGALSFKKLGLIHFFPDQRHGSLKKAHRIVSSAAAHALNHSRILLLPDLLTGPQPFIKQTWLLAAPVCPVLSSNFATMMPQ